MQPSDLSKLLNITPNTIRRWTAEFYKYLTPQASPPKGKPRIYGEIDQRVFHFVKACRDQNKPLETIHAQLESMFQDDWRGLPDVPPGWQQTNETMSVELAASKAYDFAQIAVLQRDLEHTRAELESARAALEAAQLRVITIESEMNALRASQSATQAELQQQLHQAQLELSQRAGEVETMRAKLDAFTLAYGMGRGQPLPLALVVGITALAAVLVVLVVVVVMRLVL